MKFKFILQKDQDFQDNKVNQKYPYCYLFNNFESFNTHLNNLNKKEINPTTAGNYWAYAKELEFANIPKTIDIENVEYEIRLRLGVYNKDWFFKTEEQNDKEIETTIIETEPKEEIKNMKLKYILQSEESLKKANKGDRCQPLPHCYVYNEKDNFTELFDVYEKEFYNKTGFPLEKPDFNSWIQGEIDSDDINLKPTTISLKTSEIPHKLHLRVYLGCESLNEVKSSPIIDTAKDVPKKDVPRITEISYSELITIGYSNKKFGVKVSVPEGCSPEGVFLKTEEYVKNKLANSNSDLKFENLSAMTLKEKIAEYKNKKLKEENEQLKKELLQTSEKLSRIEEVFKPKSFGDCQEDDYEDDDDMPPF